ncbi:MAG: FkbM family methyltransferase [Pseudomonadota bacterium]
MSASEVVSSPSFRQKGVSLLTRLYPLYSGCGSVANHGLIKRMSGDSGNLVWARVAGGEVLAPLDDYVGRAAFYAGELDRKIAWICQRLVRPGDTVLDIGANIGMVTVLLADLVGAEGRVESFEPNPRMCGLIRAAVQRNGFGQVRLHPVALGPVSDTMSLRIPRINAGSASLVRSFDEAECDTVTVPVRPLSELLPVGSVAAIRLMKIDVEGFEAQVFAGARPLFDAAPPQAVLFELNERSTAKLIDEPVIQFLSGYGYHFFSIPRNLVQMKLRGFNPAQTDEVEGHDFLALAPGAELAAMSKLVNATGVSNAH